MLMVGKGWGIKFLSFDPNFLRPYQPGGGVIGVSGNVQNFLDIFLMASLRKLVSNLV